jgi:hypothetical protein
LSRQTAKERSDSVGEAGVAGAGEAGVAGAGEAGVAGAGEAGVAGAGEAGVAGVAGICFLGWLLFGSMVMTVMASLPSIRICNDVGRDAGAAWRTALGKNSRGTSGFVSAGDSPAVCRGSVEGERPSCRGE